MYHPEEYGITGRRINNTLISGTIKERYEDFVVCEVLKPGIKFTHNGFPLYRIMKINAGHLELLQTLKNCNIFGIKDKFAVAYQYASSKSKRHPLEIRRKNFSITTVGFTSETLGRAHLLGNVFRIRISNWNGDERGIEDWKKYLTDGFVQNYFGPQRFGGNNIKIGKSLVMKNFSDAINMLSDDGYDSIRAVPLWLRRLFVQSYQSYLFNRALSRVINDDLRGPVINSIINEGPFKAKVPMAAMPGYSYREKDDIYSKALAEEMIIDGVKPRDFYIDQFPELSVEGGLRPATIMAAKVNYVIERNSILVIFILYRGSYATSALLELLK